ncbi:MAG: polysaccharide pyruvyl transferase family protein [Proteobacteria bacterium]|nr:polysaccharide pyruvyl transferase family protein [Pseudomonadota bacterium]
MWNCGDDFIAFGIRNLITEILPQANFIAYNRNPDLHVQRVHYPKLKINARGGSVVYDLSEYIQQTNWRFDDSWHTRTGLDPIGLCVFAGTPEWFGAMVHPLTRQLASSDVPVMYLGIGGFEGRESLTFNSLSGDDRSSLTHAKIVSVRDSQAESLLAPVKPHRLPCPSLFSSTSTRVRGTAGIKVALSCQPDDSVQPSSTAGTYEYCLKLFDELKKQYDCEIICHYIDELAPLGQLDLPVRYSYDARDYLDIYNEFDLVVTTRVHGAGIAASMGIPSFVVKHSVRTETTDGFLSKVIDVDADSPADVLFSISEVDIESWSRRLVQHKSEVRDQYLTLLQPVLQQASSKKPGTTRSPDSTVG